MTKIGESNPAGVAKLMICYDDKAKTNPYRVIQEWKEDEIDALVDDLSIKYGEDVHIDEVLTCIADAVSSIVEGWQRELTVESTVLSLINSYIKYLV